MFFDKNEKSIPVTAEESVTFRLDLERRAWSIDQHNGTVQTPGSLEATYIE